MAYGKSKYLVKRTQSVKIKHLELPVIQSMMVIKEDQLQWFTRFLIKKSALVNNSSGSGIAKEPNYQLANELHKAITRKF